MGFEYKSPDQVRRVEAQSAEMRRIHALPDRWLAAELLRLARRIRSATTYAARAEHDTYNSSMLWDVIPELARRLGAEIQPNESLDARLRRLNGDELRMFVGICNANVARGYMKEANDDSDLNELDILFHETANGNPIIMALDRIAPPTPDSTDPAATHLRHVSSIRGHAETPTWHPRISQKSFSRPTADDAAALRP